MITFAKTRWSYDSYTDFWKLVELSDYPICYVDEMDLSDPAKLYIFAPMNGELEPIFNDYKVKAGPVQAKVYLWNLERPSGSGDINEYTRSNRAWIDDGFLADVIVSDTRLAKETGFRYVPMGSHPQLGVPGDKASKVYDLIHLSCYSNIRGWMFSTPSQPRAALFGFSVAPNGWGEYRHKSLMQSRFMLNIHQDNYPFIEPLRFALAAAYGLPVITQSVTDTQWYRPGLLESPFSTIADLIRFSMNQYDHYYNSGLEYREKLCYQRTFRASLEANI